MECHLSGGEDGCYSIPPGEEAWSGSSEYPSFLLACCGMLYGITVAIAWFMLPATDRMSRCSHVVDSVGVIGRRILSQIFCR